MKRSNRECTLPNRKSVCHKPMRIAWTHPDRYTRNWSVARRLYFLKVKNGPLTRAVSILACSCGQQFFQLPHVIGETSFHRGSYAQGLMDAAEVVVCEMQCNSCSQVLPLFGERIGEPR
jgi:hypothetical protein